MIKPFLKFSMIRLIPAWIVSIFVLLVSYSSLISVHSVIVEFMGPLKTTELVNPALYHVKSNVEQPQNSVQWSGATAVTLSSYFSYITAEDFISDIPIPQDLTVLALKALSPQLPQVVKKANHGLWLPSNGSYKQAVLRVGLDSFVDQVVARDELSLSIEKDHIKSGFISVPVDIFGGLFLFTQQAPTPEIAKLGDLNAVSITEYNQVSHQFLNEIWAIDNEAWVYVPLLSLIVASLAMLFPWLVFNQIKRFWIAVSLLTIVNLALLYGLFVQLNWLYPVVLPAVSPFVAWLWFADGAKKQLIVKNTQGKYRNVIGLWVSHLLDEGKPEAAFRYLKENKVDEKSFSEIWQMVANGFERNRQFDKSLECYQAILLLDPNNGEVKSKVKNLTEVIDGSATMAIAQVGGELPVGQVKNMSLGRYQISSELGRGAMGIVYEAQDPKIHRNVALKVVHLKSLGVDEVDQVKQRFFREAQAAGKLNHPNIVTVFDVGEEHDVAYIAMDLLRGKPLSALITKAPEELVKVVKWVAEAASALGYAHENDIIHRDVKPANMIIEDKSGRLKLTDFGVARIAGVQQTQTGIVLGSPSYMSPEQIRGEKLSGSTDIFSLGVTLYQCVTGELPFAGDTLPALAYSITQAKQESPRNINSEVPVSLVRIVNKSLQKDPKDRYETAGDFANILNKWVTDHS